MAVVTTNLGAVTAYADAVAGGYTGTKAEWQALMASYGSVAEQAAESASQAADSASAASEKASEATTAASNAATAKADAETAKNAAETAQGKAETAQEAAEDAAESVSASAAQIATNTGDISELKSGFTAKVDKHGTGQIAPKNIQGVTVSGGNILDEAERLYCSQSAATLGNDGYVTVNNGRAIIQNSSSYCSFLIPVKPNTHYTANNEIRFMVTLKNLNTTGTTPVTYGDLVTTTALASVTSFDTGEAEYIIVSWNYDTYPINTFVISEGNTPTTEQTITLPDWLSGEDYSAEIDALETRVDSLENVKPKYANITGNLASGGNLQLTSPRNNLIKGERIIFEGNITSFSALTIGLTYGTSLDAAQLNNYFVIDGTNISYHATNTSTAITVAHGLTISDNIQIIWEMTAIATCKITLISDGNLFVHEFTNFVRQVVGNPFVLSDGTVLTDCKLTWACNDIDKSIWMFGDSYFQYSENRWTYYLHQYGYDQNCLLDGFPGEGGVNGRVAFNNLLQFGTPKYAVWCLGMNDTSDSKSAPASNWVTARDYFLQYCENNGVTPIFGTIPTVPSINHEKKNEWIRSSGYRYIDFAKAVGANSSGVWFNGMLSSDGVHPTAQGARALFARVLLDLPEIMVGDWR